MYRTHYKIVADVLSSTKYHSGGGVGVSMIIQKANLPYTRLTKILNVLVSTGFLHRAVTDGGVNRYSLTGRGEDFLNAYSKFAESFGLTL